MFMSIAPSIFINANGGDNVNGSSLHGKNYVFDIRRTLRQFQDDIQRTMFKLNTIFNAGLSQDTITDCDTTQSVTEQSTDQVFVSSNIMKNCNSNHFICRKMKKRSYAVYVWIDQLILLSFHVITWSRVDHAVPIVIVVQYVGRQSLKNQRFFIRILIDIIIRNLL